MCNEAFQTSKKDEVDLAKQLLEGYAPNRSGVVLVLVCLVFLLPVLFGILLVCVLSFASLRHMFSPMVRINEAFGW